MLLGWVGSIPTNAHSPPAALEVSLQLALDLFQLLLVCLNAEQMSCGFLKRQRGAAGSVAAEQLGGLDSSAHLQRELLTSNKWCSLLTRTSSWVAFQVVPQHPRGLPLRGSVQGLQVGGGC